MPKLNVYVPDDLAESVRETGLPVSAICQRALEQSVKRVSAIRATTIGDIRASDPTEGLAQFTLRARQAVKLGVQWARQRGADEVGTTDLLAGMLTENANLALQVLRTMDVEPRIALREVERIAPPGEQGAREGAGSRLSRTAANAMELTVVEAILLGHNYVGCEHLLLGLVAEPDGGGGQVLRGLGVESRQTRQAVLATLAGYQHLRANQSKDAQDQLTPIVEKVVEKAVERALEPVLRRLDRLEQG